LTSDAGFLQATAFDSLARAMPDVFWLGFGIAAFGAVVGLFAGFRSRTTATGTGLLVGTILGVLAAFPLLAIGLSTS
jgi:hypothetical protein